MGQFGELVAVTEPSAVAPDAGISLGDIDGQNDVSRKLHCALTR